MKKGLGSGILKNCAIAGDKHCDVNDAGHGHDIETGEIIKSKKGEDGMSDYLTKHTNMAIASDYNVIGPSKSVSKMNDVIVKMTRSLNQKNKEHFYGGSELGYSVIRGISTKKGDCMVVIVLLLFLFWVLS